MRRQILEVKRMKHVCGCCPGHDDYPTEKYSNNRSMRARARDIKLEHQHARSAAKQLLIKELKAVGI